MGRESINRTAPDNIRVSIKEKIDACVSEGDIFKRNMRLKNLIQIILISEYVDMVNNSETSAEGGSKEETEIQMKWVELFSAKFRLLVQQEPQIFQNFINESTRDQTIDWIKNELYFSQDTHSQDREEKVA